MSTRSVQTEYPSVLSLLLQGGEVAPENLGVAVLAKLIQAVKELTVETGADTADVSLVAIRRGSVGLDFVTSESSAHSFGPVISRAATPNLREDHDDLPSSWARLAEAVPAGLQLRIRQTFPDAKSVEAVVQPLEGLPDEPQPVAGRTTLYGRVRGVNLGIEGPKARIEVFGRDRVLASSVPESVALELGRRLGQVVAIDGEARWDPETWELLHFDGRLLLPYRDTDIVTAVNRVADASSGGWDDIDSLEVLQKLRGQ